MSSRKDSTLNITTDPTIVYNLKFVPFIVILYTGKRGPYEYSLKSKLLLAICKFWLGMIVIPNLNRIKKLWRM